MGHLLGVEKYPAEIKPFFLAPAICSTAVLQYYGTTDYYCKGDGYLLLNLPTLRITSSEFPELQARSEGEVKLLSRRVSGSARRMESCA